MPSSLMSGDSVSRAIRLLIESQAVVGIVLGHVLENDFVADIQSGEHFDKTHGGAPKFHINALGHAPAVVSFENAHGAVGLPMHHAFHVKNILKALELDRAIHREIGPRPARIWAFESHIHADGAIL